MKKLGMCAIVAGLAAAGHAYAYQFEAGAFYGQGDLGGVDFDTYGVGGEINFSQVDTSKGPLAEATFLDKASNVDFSYTETDPDGPGAELEAYNFGARVVMPQNNLILEGNVVDSDSILDDSWSFGVGTYLSDSTDVVVSYRNADDAEVESLGVDFHGVAQQLGGAALAWDAGASYIDVDGEDGYSLSGGLKYYVNSFIGFGAAVDYADLDVIETTTYTLDVDWFVLPHLRLNLAYVDTDLDVIDGDAVIGSIAARF